MKRKLVVDTFCELYKELEPWIDETFWDFAQHEPVPGSVTMFSRQAFRTHHVRIKKLAENNFFVPVLANPTEGSITLLSQCMATGTVDLVRQKKILLIGCGDLDPCYPNLWYDCYLYKPYDYKENLQQCVRVDEIFSKLCKPRKFLFLNGRARGHRKYIIERLRLSGLLDQSIWTNLDSSVVPTHARMVCLEHNGKDLMAMPTPVQLLDAQYEVDMFHDYLNEQHTEGFVKSSLFNNLWGDIYIRAEPYIDTYFSLVTETVFDYPYSLRSEKIYKPIAMGHPWIAVANRGYYRDIRNIGFRTFGHLIDESFDQIDNNQDRIERIVAVVEDLCQQNLMEFIVAARDVCKYNQQHMAKLGPKIRQEFPQRFFQFIEANIT